MLETINVLVSPSFIVDESMVWAAASGGRPASSGRQSRAAARTGRSRRTANAARAATPRAKPGSKLSGVSGPERPPAEREDSGGEASGRESSHDEDADWATRRPGDPATRRPGDPATRRPGDPATRRPGDHYTVGTLSGACQPPERANLVRPADQAQRLQDRRSRRAQRVPRGFHHEHGIASEPVARHIAPNAHACQASPVPVSRTVSRAQQKHKTDGERRPTHTFSIMARQRSADGDTQRESPRRAGVITRASIGSGAGRTSVSAHSEGIGSVSSRIWDPRPRRGMHPGERRNGMASVIPRDPNAYCARSSSGEDVMN